MAERDHVFMTGERFYRSSPDFPADRPHQRPARAFQRRGTPKGGPSMSAVQARAEINHGRWIVSCPLCDAGAQFAFENDRVFQCLNCRNGVLSEHTAGPPYVRGRPPLQQRGRPIEVIWPTDTERVAIESALRRRARIENMNWRYPETSGDLEDENRTRGVD